MITIKDLSISYDGKAVISNLSLSFKKGETVAICGPSGCGKSTLFRLIAGIEKKSSGTISFSVPKPRFSITFQEPCLLEGRTAQENVNLVLGDKKETLPLCALLLNMLGITDPTLYPDEMSGGMRARTGIARALAPDSDIYLFDEPFANLDHETALNVAEVIREQTVGKTVLCIIHDIALASKFADRVIVFDSSPLTNSNLKQI